MAIQVKREIDFSKLKHPPIVLNREDNLLYICTPDEDPDGYWVMYVATLGEKPYILRSFGADATPTMIVRETNTALHNVISSNWCDDRGSDDWSTRVAPEITKIVEEWQTQKSSSRQGQYCRE